MRLLADCTVYDRNDVLSFRARFGQFRVEKMVLDPGLISSLSSRSLVAKYQKPTVRSRRLCTGRQNSRVKSLKLSTTFKGEKGKEKTINK